MSLPIPAWDLEQAPARGDGRPGRREGAHVVRSLGQTVRFQIQDFLECRRTKSWER